MHLSLFESFKEVNSEAENHEVENSPKFESKDLILKPEKYSPKKEKLDIMAIDEILMNNEEDTLEHLIKKLVQKVNTNELRQTEM